MSMSLLARCMCM